MISITRKAAMPGLGLVLAVWVAVPGVAAETAPAAFNNHCRTCHSVKPDDNRLGPSLHNIYGAKAGSSSAYPGYSQALKTSGVTWDEATLDKFIENPDQVIPNNNMKPFKGIGDQAVRKQVIDFLKAQRASP